MKTISQKISNKASKQKSPISSLISYCLNTLLTALVDMDKRGVTEEVHQGNLKGKSRNGEDINIKYGYGIKIGLDEFIKGHKP
jgi:hypothetical protein